MTETIIAAATSPRVPLPVPAPERRSFQAFVRLYLLGGNERPHWSVQGEERNLRRQGDYQVECCGCMHDEVLRYFPDLAPLVALHLSDDLGRPMHAAANMAYWLGFSRRYDTSPSYGPQPPDLGIAARLWRVAEDDARALQERVEAIVAGVDDPDGRYGIASAALRSIAEAEHHDRWHAEHEAGLALVADLAGRAGWSGVRADAAR